MNLSVVDRVCRALDADLCELFEYVPDGDKETQEAGELTRPDREPVDGPI